MIDTSNSCTVNDGSLWAIDRLCFGNCFFFCEEEVIISAVNENNSFPKLGISGILIGTLIILSFGGFA